MEYVLIWLLFAVVSAVAASSKGNSGVLGFMLGLILGPFGLLIALLTPGTKSKGTPGGWTATCPACKSSVHPGATICPHCRTNLGVGPKSELDSY